MKILYLFLSFSFLTLSASAQILKNAAERAKQKVEQKVNQKIDKKIDDVLDGKPNAKKDKTKDKSGNTTDNDINDDSETTTSNKNTNSSPSFKSYSKFDFISGEKVVAFDDFSEVEIGDFPVKWNTNASAEIVTIENTSGKWLQINKAGGFYPEYISNLPENFTLEFDVYSTPNYSYYSTFFNLVIGKGGETKENFNYHYSGNGLSGIIFGIRPYNAGGTAGDYSIETYNNGSRVIDNHGVTPHFYSTKQTAAKTHVSIWKQKQRLRVYLNDTKVVDLPRAFEAEEIYDFIGFGTKNFSNTEDSYYLSNIKLAVGSPDTRHKLITEGKFVTSGIYFDTNSDKINPNSYGVLKNIAAVLNENPTVNIKIIGHTDSDGDDKLNQTLSEKRAEAVKKILESEFNVNVKRIITEGKGETQPIEDNSTPQGKANNRRVEFIKL